MLYAHANRVLHLETNPGNARALVQRHGEGPGARDVWINPPPIPLTTAEMDLVFDLPYARLARFPEGLDPVTHAGFSLLALTPDRGAPSIDDLVFAPDERVALVLGAEGAGLTDATLDRVGRRARIPMHGAVDSLKVAAAAAIAFLNSGGGNRLGAVIANGDTMRRVPALSGRIHERELLRAIATTPKAPTGVRGDLAAAIDALRRPERRRGMAVIISDFLGPINWMRPLRAIAGRHEVLGIEVLDPRDVELPDVGDVILQDTETGVTREFTIDAQLRHDFERAAAAHREEVARTLRRCDAPLLTLRTDRDWIADVVRFVASRRRGAAGR